MFSWFTYISRALLLIYLGKPRHVYHHHLWTLCKLIQLITWVFES